MLFDHENYRKYLQDGLDKTSIRGEKAKFARHLKCDGAYLSRVLNEKADLSLEQAVRANEYFNHDKSESHYFLLLVQYARSGTQELKKYFTEQINRSQQEKRRLEKRLQVDKKLSDVDQAVYYSSWYYSAIHTGVAVEKFSSIKGISNRLNISEEVVADVLHYLIEKGLVSKSKGRYQVENGNTHLSDRSLLISQHHKNWLQQASVSMDRYDPKKDIHYSAVFALSEQDQKRLRQQIVESLNSFLKTVQKSQCEELAALSLNFFSF